MSFNRQQSPSPAIYGLFQGWLNLLDFEDVDVAWDIIGVSFHSFTSPEALITTSVVSVFVSHILISISRSLYLDNLSATFTKVLLSDGIAKLMIKRPLSRLSFFDDVRSVSINFSTSVDGQVAV